MKKTTILGLSLLAAAGAAFAQTSSDTIKRDNAQVQQDAAQQREAEHDVNVDKTNVSKIQRGIVHQKNDIIHADAESRKLHEQAQAAAARGDTAEAQRLQGLADAQHQHSKVEAWKLDKDRRNLDKAKVQRHEDIQERDEAHAKRRADEIKRDQDEKKVN
ncbi:hypothetical protein [Piscinibacter terrae]|uniref:Uncharacterized protein n=1 Tax=Piscinibacter terrae TaxID=2496871 RepID=A0A3N7HML8_9BURK|nr:hypothetical protein [Albitalea terrae]RQP22316.1 hypothetical protein DZC73_21900 [Albitalea terrae]